MDWPAGGDQAEVGQFDLAVAVDDFAVFGRAAADAGMRT
jgi:hypothetical protein